MPRHAPERPSVVGLAWYDRKQWRLLNEVASLVSWCKEHGLPVNGESCAEYVSQLIRRRHGRSTTR